MIDLNTNRFVVFGMRNHNDTFGHIQEAWYRALKFKFPDREVYWVDSENPEDANFENALVLTVNVADMSGLPKRKDVFYAIHNTDETTKAFFGDMREYSCMNYGIHTSGMPLKDAIEVGPDMYFWLQQHEAYTSLVLRWGTDLFPHEIEANKPSRIYSPESREVNFVGTVYDNVHGPFRQACEENGIKFNIFGGFSAPPVSIEENVRLVRASHFAPAIGDAYHNKVGYLPCRTPKNISYGCFPITNNLASKEIFPDLILNQDTRQLFFDAKTELPKIGVEVLHKMMDEVAKNHTYLVKIDGILNAVRLTQESR